MYPREPAKHVALGAPAAGSATKPASQVAAQDSPDARGLDAQLKVALVAVGAVGQGSAAHTNNTHTAKTAG